ncbi:universal stress protein [Zooshikella harenae]|uniref:Universal stress protein n=1 Tax=Zooshikella harenae TaxID=2827238 RepID=A0ABS5ZAJ3_9GAMM|nr:universal stress protein [Zooshikella harenae]MBU2711014.1 universal stress protein [Zooshikella harenae]
MSQEYLMQHTTQHVLLFIDLHTNIASTTAKLSLIPKKNIKQVTLFLEYYQHHFFVNHFLPDSLQTKLHQQWKVQLEQHIKPILNWCIQHQYHHHIIYGEHAHSLEALIDFIQKQHVDLYIKPTSYHEQKANVLNHNDIYLLNTCRVPIYICDTSTFEEEPEVTIQSVLNVLICVDPLPDNDVFSFDSTLIEYAESYFNNLPVHFHIVHTYSPLPEAIMLETDLVSEYKKHTENILQQRQEALTKLQQQFSIVNHGRCHMLQGIPDIVIPKLAEEFSIDICLLGYHSHSHWQQAIYGNITKKLIEKMRCDLLIKPKTSHKEIAN